MANVYQFVNTKNVTSLRHEARHFVGGQGPYGPFTLKAEQMEAAFQKYLGRFNPKSASVFVTEIEQKKLIRLTYHHLEVFERGHHIVSTLPPFTMPTAENDLNTFNELLARQLEEELLSLTGVEVITNRDTQLPISHGLGNYNFTMREFSAKIFLKQAAFLTKPTFNCRRNGGSRYFLRK